MSNRQTISSSEFLTLQKATLKLSNQIASAQTKAAKIDAQMAKIREAKMVKLHQKIEALQRTRSQNIQRMATSDVCAAEVK